MNHFAIQETNRDDYDKLLIWLSSDSLVDHLRDIEKALNKTHLTGKILIDLLYITGNTENRFMSCTFKDDTLDLKTAQVASPAPYFRKKTIQWLHDHYEFVEQSILTENQRQKIKNNIVF